MGELLQGRRRRLTAVLGAAAVVTLTTSFTPAVGLTPTHTSTHTSTHTATRTVVHRVRIDRDTTMVGRSIRHWPGHTIRYWAKLPANYQWSLHAAISNWNATGLHMRFVRSTKSRAQTKITIGDTFGANGLATVGYVPHHGDWVHLEPGQVGSKSGLGSPLDRIVLAHIVAHELGHNLGLEHVIRPTCALMQPILEISQCAMFGTHLGTYSCRIADRAALKVLTRWYGGTTRTAPANCLIDPMPSALDNVAFSGGLPAGKPVTVSWQAPAHEPPGTKVQIIQAPSSTPCAFPVQQSNLGNILLTPPPLARKDVVATVSLSAGTWTDPQQGISTYCYGVVPVNPSGAGPAVTSTRLQEWAPTPAKPKLTIVQDHALDPTDYTPQGALPDTDTLVYWVAPTGQCVDALPSGQTPDGNSLYPGQDFYTAEHHPCVTFWAVSAQGLMSAPEKVQVVAPAAPPTPQVSTSAGADGFSIDITSTNVDGTQLALVLADNPSGQCQTTPPADPGTYALYPDSPYHFTYYPSDLTDCLSLWAMNADGVLSAVTTVP